MTPDRVRELFVKGRDGTDAWWSGDAFDRIAAESEREKAEAVEELATASLDLVKLIPHGHSEARVRLENLARAALSNHSPAGEGENK